MKIGLPHKILFVRAMLGDCDLSSTAKVVGIALVLKFHNTKSGQCNPSLDRIADAVGKKPRAVTAALSELKEGGWIAQARRRGVPSYDLNFCRVLVDGQGAGDDAESRKIADQEEWRKIADQTGHDTQFSAPRSAKNRGSKQLIEHISPLTPLAGSTEERSERAAVFVADDDPRWPVLAERFCREKGTASVPKDTRPDGKRGWRFPQSWSDDAATEIAQGAGLRIIPAAAAPLEPTDHENRPAPGTVEGRRDRPRKPAAAETLKSGLARLSALTGGSGAS